MRADLNCISIGSNNQTIACDNATGDFSLQSAFAFEPIPHIQAIEELSSSFDQQNFLISQVQQFSDLTNKLNFTIDRQTELMVHGKSLITTLESVNDTLSSTPKGSLSEVIIGALFSVIAAFTFNLIYWYLVDKKKKLSSSIARLNTVLDAFEKTATEYWYFSYHIRHSKSNKIKEMKMKAEHRILRQSKSEIVKLIHRKKTKTEVDAELTELLSSLFDSATGGDFESSERKEDLKRVGEIIKICTQIRMITAGLNT